MSGISPTPASRRRSSSSPITLSLIVSDHPVTVYNLAYAPGHAKSSGAGDPEIHLNGTHTIFPLSMNKVLILTNKSWAVNPYGSPEKDRPNPAYERDSIFNFTEIQLGRQLTEEEVLAINFIIKSRAYRYLGAAEKDWLYPERHLPGRPKWSRLGPFYLLFPDPRSLHYGGEFLLGYADGSSEAFDAFGRRPGQEGYGADSLPAAGDPLAKFKGEFAQRYGPQRRGWQPTSLGGEKEVDTDELHEYHLSQLARKQKQERTKPDRGVGQKRRRRGGKRKRR